MINKVFKLKLFLSIFFCNYLYPNSFLFNIENDFINETDRHLTNSITLSWIYDTNNSFYDKVGLEIHHNVYTPENVTTTDKTQYDMPYAGQLYADMNLYFLDKSSYHKVGLSLGFIGKNALGEESQKAIHYLIDTAQPKGWEHQIDNKNIYGLTYSFVDKLFSTKTFIGNKIDMNNNLIIQCRNDLRTLSLGSLFRYGNGFSDNFQTSNDLSSSQINFTNSIGWSISFGVYLLWVDYVYILDNYKDEYNINREDKFVGSIVSLDYYYKNSKISMFIREANLVLSSDLIKEQWFGVNYMYRF